MTLGSRLRRLRLARGLGLRELAALAQISPGNLPPGTFAIALVVPDEASLWRLADALQKARVEHRAIIEADGPFTGQLLAIGVVPKRKEELRKHLASLPLLR